MSRTTQVADVTVGLDHWIGGERVPSSGTFDDICPLDECVIADIARSSAAEAGAAVRAATMPSGSGLRSRRPNALR